MPMETSDLHQLAVYWTANGYDDYGEPKIDAAVEISTRWEIGNFEALDPQGNTISVDALVVVDREIPIGSILWLGDLADLPADPANYVDLRQVVSTSYVPDVKNRATRRTVGVIRHNNEIPTTA